MAEPPRDKSPAEEPPATTSDETPAKPTDGQERLRLQRELTKEVGRSAAAYKQLATLEAAYKQERATRTTPPTERFDHYRSPHDHTSGFDRLDRKQPVSFALGHLILYSPGLKNRTRFVPDRALAEHGDDDDGPFALVECPCEHKPIVREEIEKCLGCERYYMLTNKRVIVIYGAMKVPGSPDAPPSEDGQSCEFGECDGSGFTYEEVTNTCFDCRCRPALIAARAGRDRPDS